MAKRTVSETREASRFAVILAALLLALAGLSWWRHHQTRLIACLCASLLVLFCAFLVRPLWMRFFRLWMRFASGLSWVMTRVILSLFFYVFLTPYGMLSRLFRKDPLDLDWRRRKGSYWIDKPAGETARERYEKQF